MINKIKLFLDKNKKMKKIAITIYKPTIGYIINRRRNRLFKKVGKEALYKVDKVFNELNILYWLEFGTLLGAIREKDFIQHDLDIDLGCFFEDYNKNNEKIFEKYGFKKTREFLIDNGKFGREETYSYKGVDIDIFYFHKRKDVMFCHTFAPIEGKSREGTIEEIGGLLVRELSYPYKGFKKIKFLGKDFNIPSNVEEHLSASYGENYMIKDPNYSNKIAKNVVLLPDKLGIRRLYDK